MDFLTNSSGTQKRLKFSPFFKVNADDFGKDEKTNQCIVDAFMAGKITSTSLMVTRKGFAHAVSLSRIYNFDIGIHLDLGDDYEKFFSQYIMGDISLEWAHREIAGQIKKFKATGIKLCHIDSHLGIHFFPQIFKIVVGCAWELNVPIRNPIRRINWDIFDWKQCIGDNIQWLFYQKNKRLDVKSFDYMVEPKTNVEVVCHPQEW